MKQPRNDLIGTHGNQEIEWACACPECTEHNEGHTSLTFIGHDHTYHNPGHTNGPNAVMMVGVTPCPEMGCHMVFPFGDDLGNHIHTAHPHNSGKLGISQLALVLIPVPPSIHQIVHEAYEIPGHGARRGKKVEEGHDIHSTKSTAIKTHLRGSRSIHSKNTHNSPLDHSQSSGSSPHPSGNDGYDSGEECFLGEYLPDSKPTGWKAPVIYLDPMSNHGGGIATRKDIEHPGLTDSQRGLSQGHQQGQHHHMARIPEHTDAHSAYHSKKAECDGCGTVPEDSMLMHIEHDEHHKDIFSCWHCGHYFNKQEDHLVKHLHKMHAAAEKQRDEKRSCEHLGCKKTCSNGLHLKLHMQITHHEKAAQLDPPNFRYPGSADQNKSHGLGEGKDHSSFGKADGHEKDSHGYEKGKDHSKAGGEAKDSHGHENGKDHNNSSTFGKDKDYSKLDGHGKEALDHEKGKDHIKTDGHEKDSQEYAKDTAHEPLDHTKGKDHDKGHEHLDDEWTDEEKSPKENEKAKPTKKAKKPIAMPQRRVGTKAKKPASSRMGFFGSKKK